MLKKLSLTVTAFLAVIGIANAISGNQLGLPIVGGASYCASYGNGAVCNSTIPAGPAVVTGNETVIANTNLPSGQNPQTVLLTMSGLNALPYQYVSGTALALNAGTTTVPATTGTLILNPAGTITSYTVVLPASTALTDGQMLAVTSTNTITGLTVTAGAGTTVSNAPTALTISTTATYGYKFIYDAVTTVWYRVY